MCRRLKEVALSRRVWIHVLMWCVFRASSRAGVLGMAAGLVVPRLWD